MKSTASGILWLSTTQVAFLLIAGGLTRAEVDGEIIPDDTCIISMELPKGAKVTLQGRDYGDQRTFKYGPLKTHKVYSVPLVIHYPSGAESSDSLRIEGGRRIRLAYQDPNTHKPTLVPPFQHHNPIRDCHLTADGTFLATYSDQRVLLWSRATGKPVATFERGGRFVCHNRMVLNWIGGNVFLWECPSGNLRCKITAISGIVGVSKTDDGRYMESRIVGASATADGRYIAALCRRTVYEHGHSPRFSSGTSHETITVWDTASETLVRTFPEEMGIEDLVFAGNKRHLYVLKDDEAVMFDLDSGQRRQTVYAATDRIRLKSMAVSPREDLVALYESRDDQVIVVNTATGDEAFTLSWRHRAPSMSFNNDGSQLLMADSERIRIWHKGDVEPRITLTDEELRTRVGDSVFYKACFGPGGARVITLDNRGGLAIHDLDGQLIERYASALSLSTYRIGATRLLRDNRLVLFLTARTADLSVRQDYEEGEAQLRVAELEDWRMPSDATAVRHIGTPRWFIGNSHLLEVQRRDTGTSVAWDIVSNEEVAEWKKKTIFGGPGSGSLSALSPDLRYGCFTHGGGVSGDKHTVTCRIQDLQRNETVGSYSQTVTYEGAHTFGGGSACFSPNGRYCVFGKFADGDALLIDMARKQTHRLRNIAASSFAFSPDSSLLAIGTSGSTAAVYRLSGRQPVLTAAMSHKQDMPEDIDSQEFVEWLFRLPFSGRVRALSNPGVKVVFSRGGSQLLLNNTLYSVRDGETVLDIKGKGACFGGDGSWIVSSARDNSELYLTDFFTGKLIATLDVARQTTRTPEGLFDGPADAIKELRYRVGSRSFVPVDRFYKEFYRPDLLAAILRGERPLPGVEMGRQLPPKLRLVSPKPGPVTSRTAEVIAEATDVGGGIASFNIYQNGSRLLTESETITEGKTIRRTFPVSLIEGENLLEVRATCEDGSWESEPASVRLIYEKPVPGAELYLVAVGINRYSQETMNLRFAKTDAEAMAKLFTKRGEALYGQGKVHVRTLVDEQATASNIEEALSEVAEKAQSQDTLVVTMSGHGTMIGSLYYFIPHELTCEPSQPVEEAIRAGGLPQYQLNDWIKSSDRDSSQLVWRQRVVVFCACRVATNISQ